MTSDDLLALQAKLDRHVVLACLDGDQLEGDLVMVWPDGVAIEVDADSNHDKAGAVVFVTLQDISSVRETAQAAVSILSLAAARPTTDPGPRSTWLFG
jgi:hypothetical protein